MERLATPTAMNIDPVCGMEVDPGRTGLVAIYQGHSYWFCAEACQAQGLVRTLSGAADQG